MTGTAAYHPIHGLEALETGLHTLHKSRLQILPEFKGMCDAISRHYQDLKLAHLTGKAKDLQEQAVRDTKFYNILTKMLCEIEGKRFGQRENLKRVYTWYMANKHVLYCGPHFGREKIKEEAQEILRKATTPRSQTRAKSAVERNLMTPRKISSRSARRPTSTPRHPATNPKLSFRGDPPPSFRLDLDYFADYEPYNSVSTGLGSGEQKSGQPDGRGHVLDEEEEEIDEGPVGHSASPSPPRTLSRPKTAATAKFSSSKDLRNMNTEVTTPRTLQRMVHPIPSYVNPHAVLAKECSPVEPETIDVPKIVSSRSLPPETQAAWQHFYKGRCYGQDVMSNLKFAGRSGTASDVRYTAHTYGESPELHTRTVLKHLSSNVSPAHMSPKEPVEEENAFVQQTLEEFYEKADTILAATTKNTPRKSAMKRIKSAPVKGNSGSVSRTLTSGMATPAVKSTQENEQFNGAVDDSATNEVAKLKVPMDTGVRLNTVINIIDSVSDDMAFFKEKVGPEPQAGFRQPSTTGLPTPRDPEVSRATELDMVDSTTCPVSSPMPDEINEMIYEASHVSSPFASRTLAVRENVAGEGKRKPLRCSSAGVLDWRARIQPETMRYKWSKTKFGGHTYLKKWHRPNLRSAGSASGRKRPKTAPTTTKERWKTEKESDKNERAVQAANHNVKLVDQDDVDTMLSVQHLLGDGDRTDSLDSLLGMDEAFWRNLRKSRPPPSEDPPTMEFLSFITPTAAAIAEQRAKLTESGTTEEQGADRVDLGQQFAAPVAGHAADGREVTPIHVPDPNYDVDALNAAVSEELQEDVCSTALQGSQVDQQSVVFSESTALGAHHSARPRSHVEVRSILPSGRRPATAAERSQPLQELSQSEEWHFSLADELTSKDDLKKSDHFCDVQLDSTIPGVDTRDSMTTKVQRSAGRMPSQSHSTASTHMLAYSRRYTDTLRRAPPLRTPPSIPTPQPSGRRQGRLSSRSGGGGPVLAELERHARRARSPRNLMNTVNTLRSEDGAPPESEVTQVSNDSIVGMTLQVCRLPTSSRGRWSQVSTDNDFDFNTQLLQSLSREPSFLHSIHETQDYTGTGPQISSYSQRRTSGQTVRKPTTAPSLEWARSQTGRSEDLGLYRNSTWTSIGSRQFRGRQGIDPRTMIVGRPYSKAGRPIAQVSKVPDPDELYDAVVKQKEAAAAVDIQRIFRGYVARNVYKSLLSEEIQRKEEERRAAVKIQSIYRGHMSRKQAIYNRPPLNPELIKWSKDVKAIQDEHSQKRQVKMDALANEISENHRVAAQKISTIGPHVEVYDIYHPKKTGPTKRELNLAAIRIQKVVRGWMIRRKMEKLSRKATWYGSNFSKMVKEYKTMLKRVQQQHGVDKASTPFSITDMNNYIDTRRRYESVFEKKSFGGELEHGDIEAFFRECDLYPSHAEIEEAMDVTMRGQSSKRESKGLKKKELMDMIFYIYTPTATGLKNTRQSTWMSPIIEGQEARKLLGSEFVEPAPLAPCAKLVIDTKREQRLKEQAQKEADEKRRIAEEREKREAELRKQQ